MRTEKRNWIRGMLCVCCATSLVMIMQPATSQGSNWPHLATGAVPICTAEYRQYRPEIASDDAGGAIITWYDLRVSTGDIYAQRVDGFGNVLWTADGEAICTYSHQQHSPRIVSDAAGGAVITWQDSRDGLGIYIQRVDANGNALWASDGVSVCTASGNKYWPELAADGAGGAIVAWEDHRSADCDIYTQRVAASGTLAWGADGVSICSASEDQRSLEIVPDGVGGAIVAWNDFRNGEGDIFAQRLSATGDTLWAANGVAVCTASEHQGGAVLVSDGAGGAIIAWMDNRSPGYYDIYAQRIGANGVALWDSDGVPVCTALSIQQSVDIVGDNAGGAVLTWLDYRVGDADIYAQRVNADGNALWTTDGVPVCTAQGTSYPPTIISDIAGGAVIVWRDARGADQDVYVQRVDATGNPLWTTDGVVVGGGLGDQEYPRITSDESGGAIVVWETWPTEEEDDLHAQRIERNGYLGYPSPDVTGVIDYPNDQGGWVIASWLPSYLDAYPYQLVTHYSVWRKYPEEAAMKGLPLRFALEAPRERYPEDLVSMMTRSGWSYVGEVEAYYFDEYSYEVPSYGDSTEVGIPGCAVRVLAHTEDQWTFWESAPDTGYSVDNLPPGAPLNLAADRPEVEVTLNWEPPVEDAEDLSFYAIYRSTDPEFIPGGVEDALATVGDTTYVDEEADPGQTYYYLVSAVDVHGNEGDVSNQAMAGACAGVDTDAEGDTGLALHPAHPNPFNPTTQIRFDLPEAMRVQMVIYDVLGARVATLADEHVDSGHHLRTWNGRDDQGRPVSDGVYFVRLKAGQREFKRKLVMVR